MKEGIYVHYGSKIELTGVEKKIKNQINEFSKYYEMNDIVVEKEKTNVIKSILWRLPGGSWGVKYNETLKEIELVSKKTTIDFFYIRKPLFDKKSLRFLKSIRKKNNKAKVIMELPTYPYAKELLNNKTMWPWFFKDVLYKRKLVKYIDRFVTYSQDDLIYGVKAITIKNGIPITKGSLDDIRFEKNEIIDLLAVAQFQNGHGYERIINSIYDYYKSGKARAKICLHMVGEGEEKKYYQELVNDLNLNEYVLFYGALKGEELNKLYVKADIGLGSFGAYKNKQYLSSALKIREYLAWGLPIVSGMKEDIFPNGSEKYYLEFPNDSSSIEMEEIINFYNRIYKDDNILEVRNDVFHCMKEKISIEYTMKPIIDYINE